MPPQTQTITLPSAHLSRRIATFHPSVDANNNLLDSLDEKKVTKSDEKLKRIVKHHRDPFLYIPRGDFSIVWTNVILFAIAHIITIYNYHKISWALLDNPYEIGGTMIVGVLTGYIAGLGITAGAHRLWSHKSYKAKLPLRIFLMICQTMAGQNCLYVWCREHRVHHKFSETDADPHNTNRGFFFAHVGWLLRKKHPEVIIKSAKLDFSDLLADPVVKFQMKHYNILYLIFAVFIPAAIPYYMFNITIWQALAVYVMRYMVTLHSTWFVNSTAHMFGEQPYSKKQEARENSWVSYGALGEGYHNYHHTFPFDYRTAEDGMKLNASKLFIDFMKFIGQAYDLKTVTEDTIQATKEKVRLGLEH